jgi:hypothetical protein
VEDIHFPGADFVFLRFRSRRPFSFFLTDAHAARSQMSVSLVILVAISSLLPSVEVETSNATFYSQNNQFFGPVK